MPRYKKSPRRKRQDNNKKLHATASRLDDLAEFEEFRAVLLPKIRGDLEKGLGAEEILKKYQSYVAARLVSIALGDADSTQAQSAAKDILNRIQGKPTENKKVEHKFEKLDDKELDAILATELDDLKVVDGGKK